MDEKIAKVVARYKQWTIGATHSAEPVLTKPAFAGHPERNYDLRNSVTGKFLQHEPQTWGINLGWTDSGSDVTGRKVARWFFTRKGNAEGPLRYGETIALGNGEKPSFIHYEHRNAGINLGYSDQPSYEWRVLGGKPGDGVKTHDAVALYNEKEGGECLIYFDRDAGGDIGWPTSRSWFDQITDAAWKEVRKAALKLLLTGML